jgi:hypothetical protein
MKKLNTMAALTLTIGVAALMPVTAIAQVTMTTLQISGYFTDSLHNQYVSQPGLDILANSSLYPVTFTSSAGPQTVDFSAEYLFTQLEPNGQPSELFLIYYQAPELFVNNPALLEFTGDGVGGSSIPIDSIISISTGWVAATPTPPYTAEFTTRSVPLVGTSGQGQFIVDFSVPEPNSLSLLGLGLSALAFLRRR